MTTCCVSADHQRGPAGGWRDKTYMLCNRGHVAARDLRVINDKLQHRAGLGPLTHLGDRHLVLIRSVEVDVASRGMSGIQATCINVG